MDIALNNTTPLGFLKHTESLSRIPYTDECVAYVLPWSSKTKLVYAAPLNIFFCCHIHYVFGAVYAFFSSNTFQLLCILIAKIGLVCNYYNLIGNFL